VSRRMSTVGRPGKRLLAAGAAVSVVVAAGLVAAVATSSGPGPTVTHLTVGVLDGPARDQVTSIDTRLYVPSGVDAAHPAPAVILAHGFGGNLGQSDGDARDLASRGYVALTYSARGFGKTGGLISMDSPDYDVVDVHALVDRLAATPGVLLDAPGDPRVGITGPSYGGGISLMAAAYDPRIDATVPVITWNDLGRAFSPNAAAAGGGTVATEVPGVFKSGWASLFFSFGSVDGSAAPSTATASTCAGFIPAVCDAYAASQKAGTATPKTLALLHADSIASVVGRLHAPTLLMQGETDTLFPLAEADATATALRAQGTPVAVTWIPGGHDGGSGAVGANTTQIRTETAQWFGQYLKRDGSTRKDLWTFQREPTGTRASVPAYASNGGTQTYTLGSTKVVSTPPARGLPAGVLSAGAAIPGTRTFVNPPGGEPRAFSSLPGLGSVDALLGGLGADFPGQNAAFDGPTLQKPLELAGTPTVSVRLASSTGTITGYAKLYDVDADQRATLPGALVAPFRASVPRDGTTTAVTITLPTVAHRFATGHRLRLVLASTDQAFRGSAVPAVYTIATDTSSRLTLPLSPSVSSGGLSPVTFAAVVLAGLLLVAGLVGLLTARRRRSRFAVSRQAALNIADRVPPLEVLHLSKVHSNGFTAVDDLSFTVLPGQVVGLLGPNGAGKTTTMRMALGLIHPTGGEVKIFGTVVTPGSPALERVGAFVEGTGFNPALSGLDNLQLWWRANGSALKDAHLDEALVVAGLGDAVHRPVKTYSQGMRQRLALAQAMLGKPDMVILDEPTNGLDPPQIKEMRRVIADLAARGTTVLVSSHLLSEVEQVCTHVVVMAKGKLIAAGTVAEVVGADAVVHVETTEATTAARVAATLGCPSVETDATGVVVELGLVPRPDLTAALVTAGVPVAALTPRRALEDVFLELVGA